MQNSSENGGQPNNGEINNPANNFVNPSESPSPEPTGPTIIQTDEGNKDGQNKCPKCGATDISLNVNNGQLRCNFCRHEFQPVTISNVEVQNLVGEVLGSGATNIIADANEMLTFKCSSCGAEVIIDTAAATQARCHWCRNTLSVNQQIPNGAVPDMVLPFGIAKDVAQAEITSFVEKRKFFAHPKFKAEFCTANIMGVYLPYMVVDINASASLIGQGERLIRRYTRGSNNNRRTYYDADLYNVERHFDVFIDDLTVESSADKLQHDKAGVTNNVINAIMPFDTENSVRWDANYIKGYTSEKRDTNIDDLRTHVDLQAKDITRHKANDTLTDYDRGVRWSSEQLNIKGQKWKAAYLPVWLYSYQQESSTGKTLHYVAVNARSKKTMGSVPIHMPKLLGVSAIIQVLGLLLWWTILIDFDFGWLMILSGFVYFSIFYSKYRNKGARHTHEKCEKTKIENVRVSDVLVGRLTKLRNSRIDGANNTSVSNDRGVPFGNKMLNNVASQNGVAGAIMKQINKKD